MLPRLLRHPGHFQKRPKLGPSIYRFFSIQHRLCCQTGQIYVSLIFLNLHFKMTTVGASVIRSHRIQNGFFHCLDLLTSGERFERGRTFLLYFFIEVAYVQSMPWITRLGLINFHTLIEAFRITFFSIEATVRRACIFLLISKTRFISLSFFLDVLDGIPIQYHHNAISHQFLKSKWCRSVVNVCPRGARAGRARACGPAPARLDKLKS